MCENFEELTSTRVSVTGVSVLTDASVASESVYAVCVAVAFVLIGSALV